MSGLSNSVKNPQGRADWLASKLLERTVVENGDPLIALIHREFAPHIDIILRQTIGPKTKHGRAIKKYVTEGRRLMGEVAKAQQQRRNRE